MFEKPAVQKFVARARKVSYRSRQLVARGGDTGWLFLLLEGSVSLLVEHSKGRQAVLGYLFPGDFFGEGSLCPGALAQGVTARARGSALVAMMSSDDFSALARKHSEIAQELAAQLARRLGHAHQQLASHVLFDVTERLRQTLANLARQPGARKHQDGVLIRVNRQDLGYMVGCSREMVARVLKRLEREAQIATTGHNVLVRAALLS